MGLLKCGMEQASSLSVLPPSLLFSSKKIEEKGIPQALVSRWEGNQSNETLGIVYKQPDLSQCNSYHNVIAIHHNAITITMQQLAITMQ